ncbi:hypothetical protein BGX38DRAFT_1142965 [Terfezia claveryi]|nr:hypothetical protein BGX38DRAFT_1142965 [Terfezia claveryi]
MSSLHCFPAPANTPSFSGYCQKLETFFRLSSFTNYILVLTSPRSSPTGKLPYITIHHVLGSAQPDIIADSHFIIRNLICRGTISDPDAGLTPEQKSDSRALCVWVEQHIYPAVVHQRWSREHNVAVMIATLPVPWFIKPLLGWYLRRNILNSLWTAGIGRYSDWEVDEVVVEWLDALEAKFADGREWLMGVGMAPGIVDATVWGFCGCGRGELRGIRVD